MLKRVILLGILALICGGAGGYGLLMEANTPSGWWNGVYTVALVVPSCAFLLSLPNFLLLKVYKTKRVRDITSALCPAVLNLAGMCGALVHYGFPAGWGTILVPCVLISGLLGAVSFLAGRLLWAMRSR